MGVARCNKSTGDMLAACQEKQKPIERNQKKAAGSNAQSKFEQLKQTSLSYLMLGLAGRNFSSKSNKSLASSEEEEEEEADEHALAGRRKPLLAESFGIDLDSDDVTQQQQQQQQWRLRHQHEGNDFLQPASARSSCYIWLAERDEQPDEPLELESKMNCHPSERHIRLALSSPMLHESLSLGLARKHLQSRHDLEQFACPPTAKGERCVQLASRRASCKSLAEAPTSAPIKSGKRRKLRQRQKLNSSRETRSRRRRRLPIVCDSDSDSHLEFDFCEPGAELRQRAKARHHARSAADLPLMLHNCETIDAGQRSAATPANNSAEADKVRRLQRSAIVALDAGVERQFASGAGGGLGELASPPPPLKQTNTQPGQRRGRPTSSAAENNAERRQESSPDAADKLAGAANGAELANGRPARNGQPISSSPSTSAHDRQLTQAGASPERNRTSSGQDQDQSCRRERDGVEGKLKLRRASERDAPQTPGEHLDQQGASGQSDPARRDSKSMGVDVNTVVSRLVDTCAQSWRRSQTSLLGSLSSSAGCYKVAQLSADLVSSRPCEQQQQQQQQQQEQEVARDTKCDSGQQVATSRLTRPGRSPVSLQRQTNARLARHRLKIQQQRQEQLANLARGAREQFHYRDSYGHNIAPGPICSTTSFQHSSQHPDHTEIEILETEPPLNEQPRSSSLDQSLQYFRNLIGRLPAPFNPSRRQSRELTPVSHNQDSLATTTRLPLASFDGQLPARVPIGARSFRGRQPQAQANQPAESSSSSCNQHALTIEPSHLQRAINANISSASSRSRRQRDLVQVLAQANVIVHRSPIDLLHDGRGATVSAHSRHHTRHQQESRRSVGQRQASRGQQESQQQRPQAQQHQFRFQYHHMAAEQQNGKSSAGRGQKADDSHSNSGDSSASSTLSLNKPFCKICHLSSSKHGDKLISPCKCSGTMQYVHCGCLLKWLEISNRTNEKQPMSCELCAHEYTWHKQFNLKQMKLPKCSIRDIFLHSIFVLALGVMMFCALAPMFNTTRMAAGQSMTASNIKVQLSTQGLNQNPAEEAKLSSRGGPTFGDDALGSLMSNPNRRSPFKAPSSNSAAGSRLANDEKFILFCAAAFFISFFIAIYAQTKARDTLYGLIVKFTNMNLTYYITEYDHGQQQQQQPTSNKCAADYCNSLCNPTDRNHGDLNHCQPPSAGGIHEAALIGQTHGRHRADYIESPSSWRHFKRT